MSKTLDEIAKKRCEEISNELAKEPWYIEITNDIIATQKEICGYGNDIKPLLNKYDELCLKIHHKTEEQIYVYGFKDGSSR